MEEVGLITSIPKLRSPSIEKNRLKQELLVENFSKKNYQLIKHFLNEPTNFTKTFFPSKNCIHCVRTLYKKKVPLV